MAGAIGVFRAANTNVADDARTDIKVRGFWTRAQSACVDVGGFHLDAASYAKKTVDPILLEHERRKKLEYAECIIHVDRGTFTPLIFSTTGCARNQPISQAFVRYHICWLATTTRNMEKIIDVLYPDSVSIRFAKGLVRLRLNRNNPGIIIRISIVTCRQSGKSES